jgi:hypothetical protein
MSILDTLLALFLALGPLQASTPMEGTWEAKADGIPAATLTLVANDGRVEGNLVFYCLNRTQDGGWKVIGQLAMPLLDSTTDGATVRFKLAYQTGPCSQSVFPDKSSSRPFTFQLTKENLGQLVSSPPEGTKLLIQLPLLRVR